jgi:hypothetical protein
MRNALSTKPATSMVLLVLALGLSSTLAVDAQEQTPRVTNGRVETRPAGANLEKSVRELAGAGQAAWVGYVVDGVGSASRAGDGNYGGAPCGTVFLEGRRTAGGAAREDERTDTRAIAILFRVGEGTVQKIRTSPADCPLDAGGLQVHWLTGADPAQSVGLLAAYVKTADAKTTEGTTAGQPPSWNAALAAIALHGGQAATRALERFVGGGQPPDIRKRAAFWLGATRGAEGFATLRRYAESDPDDGFRRELPLAISISRDPGGVDLLLRMARHDANSEVRRQAIFWLGQKAGEKIAGALADAAASDPDTAIKERAVFALSRMPDGEGIPKLIEVARTNSNPAVRKRAVFWLAQSSDPKAVDYLVEILKK